MKNYKILVYVILAVLSATACTAKASTEKSSDKMSTATNPGTADALVDIETTAGNMQIRLFGDTPAHRDNFLKLVREGYYNGTLFHRVISNFMIQAGDPDSKNAPKGKMLGSGDPGYTLDAEIVYPGHFHRRGALAAARQGDNVNPGRRSSGSQFYIVTGQVFNDSTLTQMEGRLQMAQKQDIFNRLQNQFRDSIMSLRRNRDQEGLNRLRDDLIARTEAEAAASPAKFTDEQRSAYTTVGGAPHLDNQYTVFGEIVSGMDVVEKIEKAETDRNDRPVDDIRIIKMSVVGE